MTTQWVPIKEFETRYAINRDGQVISLERYVTLTNRWGDQVQRRVPERIIAPLWSSSGRLRAHLYRDGRVTYRPIAHLVLDAFVGPRPPGARAQPVNGDYSDRRATNWRWAL